MTTETTTIRLDLPASLKTAVERIAAAGGTSLNQFLVTAAAEKLSAIETADAFFAARKGRGDAEAAIKFLRRAGGEPPQAGDRREE